MVELKEKVCPDSDTSSNYGDDLRLTLKPSYCACRKSNCSINILVTKYKNELKTFQTYVPRSLGYPMLL